MKLKITESDFALRIKERFPEERFEIVEYSGTGNPLKAKCVNRGEIISVKAASNFLCKNKVYGCKKCHEDRWNREEKTALLSSSILLSNLEFQGLIRDINSPFGSAER